MIQLPPINKASDSSVTIESSSLNHSKSVDKKRSKSGSKCCSCNESLPTCSCHAPLMPTYQNTYLLASNAPRLVYSNLPIFQVPYFAQSTCNVVGCKDCGFGQQPSIDEYLRKKIAEQLKLYDQNQDQSTKIHQSVHRRRSCCCCCDCESDEEDNVEKNEKVEKVESTKLEVETKHETRDQHETKVESTRESDKEEFDANYTVNQDEELKTEKTEQNTEDYESGNYKIAYCCCGKNCHTKAFSNSFDDIRKTGPATKYDINYVKPRRARMLTRSTSALETNRSRSRSAKSRSPSSKPPWIPTGQNQYFNTHSARSNLMSGHKYAHDSSTMPIQNNLNNSINQNKTCTEEKGVNTYSNHTPTYYTYQSYEPSKTTIKTTIDSKSYVKPLDYHYFNVVTEKSLPKITQKSVNYECGKGVVSDYIRPLSASASYSYTKTQNPSYNYTEVKSVNHSAKNNGYYTVAPSYANAHHKTSSDHYQPVDSTFKGKLYAKNNEIHYVSDNAARSWNSNKNPHVKIVNSTGPVVLHE